jgi:hypothetical protein
MLIIMYNLKNLYLTYKELSHNKLTINFNRSTDFFLFVQIMLNILIKVRKLFNCPLLRH